MVLRLLKIASVALAATLGACQVSPAPEPAKLGFNLIIDNGAAELNGRVTTPVGLVTGSAGLGLLADAGKPRFDEQRVAGALVEAIDQQGQPVPGVPSVRTDEHGWFQLRGWPIGQAAFVRVKFLDKDDRPRYLFAYARPDSRQVCLTVSLSTTVVSAKVAQDENLYAMYDPAKLATIVDQVNADLPAALSELLAGALPAPTDDPKAIYADILDQLTRAPVPTTPGSTPLSPFFDQLGPKLESALDTFLVVTFSLNSIGANNAPYKDLQNVRHLMIGQVKVLCRGPQAGYDHVNFWLNNTPVGQGRFVDGAWALELDTSEQPDGAYVLTALAEPNSPGQLPLQTKAFVYVRNTLPNDAGECEPGEASPATSDNSAESP